MSSIGRKRAGIVTIAAVAAAVALPGAAPAETTSAGKFRYVQRTFTTPADSQSTQQVARCPRGTHVYGGGMDAHQSYDRGVINGSFPVDLGDRDRVPDDGWAAYYDNYMPISDDAVVTAICGRVTPRYLRSSAMVPAQQFKTLNVRCPAGTYAWGGGGVNRGPYRTFFLSQTFPNGARAWKSTLANVSPSPYRAFGFAICGPRKPRYVRESITVSARSPQLWDADCPNQTWHLISGGGSSGSPGFISLATANPADGDGETDGAPDDEMTVTFHNYSDSSYLATAHAVCLR